MQKLYFSHFEWDSSCFESVRQSTSRFITLRLSTTSGTQMLIRKLLLRRAFHVYTNIPLITVSHRCHKAPKAKIITDTLSVCTIGECCLRKEFYIDLAASWETILNFIFQCYCSLHAVECQKGWTEIRTDRYAIDAFHIYWLLISRFTTFDSFHTSKVFRNFGAWRMDILQHARAFSMHTFPPNITEKNPNNKSSAREGHLRIRVGSG